MWMVSAGMAVYTALLQIVKKWFYRAIALSEAQPGHLYRDHGF
jgi:hypothetical protein